jgi:hypothetical protein
MAIRDLAALRQSVTERVEREADALDLSSVWPAVEAAIAWPAPRPARILPLRRGVPAAPLWGALMALAASVFVWLSGPSTELATQVATQVASADRQAPPSATVRAPRAAATALRPMRFSNDADIDRLAGKDIAVRREPKSGTTIIWVNHLEEAR